MSTAKRLSDMVALELLSLITVEKRFKPGEKLPNENDLSKELNVSRTTLREATRMLVLSGVLEVARGKGTYISKDALNSRNNIPGTSLNELASIKAQARDLYEARVLFEPQIASLAASRATETEVNRIRETCHQLASDMEKKADRSYSELSFHRAIVQATHNDFLISLFPIIAKSIEKGIVLADMNQDYLKIVLADHIAIADFIAMGNPEGARSAMNVHLLKSKYRFELE